MSIIVGACPKCDHIECFITYYNGQGEMPNQVECRCVNCRHEWWVDDIIMEFDIGQSVLVYDRYRFGGVGIPATVEKRQHRKNNDPEYLCRVIPSQAGIPWPPSYEKNKLTWYCEGQLRARLAKEGS